MKVEIENELYEAMKILDTIIPTNLKDKNELLKRINKIQNDLIEFTNEEWQIILSTRNADESQYCEYIKSNVEIFQTISNLFIKKIELYAEYNKPKFLNKK